MISAGEFRKGVTFEYEISIYTVVDFQHGIVGIRTHVKNARNTHIPVGTDRGRVIEQAFNTGKLIFQRCSDRTSQRLRVSPGIRCRNGNARRRNVRVLRHRQDSSRHQTGQNDDDRHHRGKDRATNTKLGKHTRPLLIVFDL